MNVSAGCEIDAGTAYCLLDRYLIDVDASCELFSFSMNTVVRVVSCVALIFALSNVIGRYSQYRDEKQMTDLSNTPLISRVKVKNIPTCFPFTLMIMTVLLIATTAATSSNPSWIASYWKDELKYCRKWA